MRCSVASKADIPMIVAVMQDTNYATYFYPGKSAKEVGLIIETNKTAIYLVCKEARQVVGYFIIDALKGHLTDASHKLKKQYAYHAGVGILSSERGKGLATRITKYAFGVAKKKGFLGIYADVGSNNHASLALQVKCGFRELFRYESKNRPAGIQNVVFVCDF